MAFQLKIGSIEPNRARVFSLRRDRYRVGVLQTIKTKRAIASEAPAKLFQSVAF